METQYHKPVLLFESIDALITNPDGVYVDCTFGGGGHSSEILKRLSANGRLFGFDQDPDAILNTSIDKRFMLIQQNFRFIQNFIQLNDIERVEGIIADLGVSSHQFNIAERGFSTRFDAKLDMRMNSKQLISAKNIVNEYAEQQLAEVIFKYGELREAKRLAKEIVMQRHIKPIESTQELITIFHYIPQRIKNKFFAQLFQAIRIEVNQEILVLKEMLLQSQNMINKEGRLVVISYHSLEDRLVKRFLKKGLFEGEPQKDIYGNWNKPFKELHSKAIVPSLEEIKQNSRARSAKLRIGIKN